MLGTLTVWYNTKCPVCDAGIGWQRRRLSTALKSGSIVFRDINLEPDALLSHGASLEAVRKRLHGRDETGNLFVGADCAREIWLRTPGDVWLGRLTGLPLVRTAARLGYDGFAIVLYRWNRWMGHW